MRSDLFYPPFSLCRPPQICMETAHCVTLARRQLLPRLLACLPWHWKPSTYTSAFHRVNLLKDLWNNHVAHTPTYWFFTATCTLSCRSPLMSVCHTRHFHASVQEAFWRRSSAFLLHTDTLSAVSNSQHWLIALGTRMNVFVVKANA